MRGRRRWGSSGEGGGSTARYVCVRCGCGCLVFFKVFFPSLGPLFYMEHFFLCCCVC